MGSRFPERKTKGIFSFCTSINLCFFFIFFISQGLSLASSQIAMNFGGKDISRLLHSLMLKYVFY